LEDPVSRLSAATPLVEAQLLTAKQVSAFLNVTAGTVYRMVERGELPAVRLGPSGRTLRFRSDQLRIWLARHESPSLQAGERIGEGSNARDER
jgi:excisionase family DNA binding protein